MSAEVQSTAKQTDLMAFAKKVAGMNSLDTVFGDSFGFVNHDQLVDKTLYDHRLLDAMTIPPTIALVGHNIDYNDLSQSKIEAVAIGLGQRAFILIDVDKNGIFHGPSPVYSDDEVETKMGDFMVVCRSPNNQ